LSIIILLIISLFLFKIMLCCWYVKKYGVIFVIQLTKQIALMDSIRKSILLKAFDLIDTSVSAFCLCSLGHPHIFMQCYQVTFTLFFAIDLVFLPI
jgi:hypothetical protein